jgi:hypothetical protein
MTVNNIESYLELLTGLEGNESFTIVQSDHTILFSIARQVYKGIGLTDRQYDLVKLKLLSYASQFTALGYDVVNAVNTTRIPIREFDRSRWIKIVTAPTTVVESQETSYPNALFIAVRFTFQKKLISALEQINDKPEHYDKLNKIQYFNYSDQTLYKIMTAFKDSNFEVEDSIKERYNVFEMMNNNKNDYIPGIYGLKLKNLHNKAIDYMITDIGDTPNTDNLALYKDKSNLYNIQHFDEEDLNLSVSKLTTLSQKIVRRKTSSVLVNSDEHVFDRVAETILELNRYPILVCLNDRTDFASMQTVYYSFRNIFNNEDMCVLYRKDNSSPENIEFNDFIKDNNINNSLAQSSKIVYTNVNKMSKTLLKSNWKPSAVILMDSVRQSGPMNAYIQDIDLVIHYDTDISTFSRSGLDRGNNIEIL